MCGLPDLPHRQNLSKGGTTGLYTEVITLYAEIITSMLFHSSEE